MKKLSPLLLPATAGAVIFLLPNTTGAAILPEQMGNWRHGPARPAAVPDAKVWQEYGLQDSETADYTDGSKAFTASAYRFQDATGASGGFQHIRPADARSSDLSKTAAETDVETVVAVGNYLFVFNKYRPKPEELNYIVGAVPRYAQTPLPSFPGYLPPGAQPGSERYIGGPESLAKFAPSIPPSIAAFHFGSEAEVARYGPKGRELTLALFSYPSMEMARDRYPHFQQVPNSVVKRSGPLVAIVLAPPNQDDAERLLSQVRYQAEVTIPEHVPTLKDNPINLFWNIFKLCGVLAVFCVLSGLAVGGLRVLLRRGGASGEGEAMISLNLSGRKLF